MLSDEKNQKINRFIKGNLANFVVLLSSIAYILYGQVGLEKNNSSALIITVSAILGFFCAIIIKQSIGENGLNKGYSSNIWQESFQKYINTCNLANDYLDRIDNFYLYEEIRLKKEYRRKMLMRYRMHYEWFFDDIGNFVENKAKWETLDKIQLKILKKCINVKIYNLNLLSEYDNDEENLLHKEKTDKDQRSKMARKNMFTQLFTAVAGVYFLPTLVNWNWNSLIMSTIQVTIWIGSGVIQLYANYNYIVIDKVSKLSRKKEGIVRFVNGCQKGLYINSPYDSEKTAVIGEKTAVIQVIDKQPDISIKTEIGGENNG